MGIAVLDSGVIIGVLASDDAHHHESKDALLELLRKGTTLVVPASVYAEVLVDPFRSGSKAVTELDSYILALPAVVEPVSADIAKTAARLRAIHKHLLLPDALVVATGMAVQADEVLTTDRRWPKNLGIPVRLIGGG
jgi:predicted nucleic acid-binding protein